MPWVTSDGTSSTTTTSTPYGYVTGSWVVNGTSYSYGKEEKKPPVEMVKKADQLAIKDY